MAAVTAPVAAIKVTLTVYEGYPRAVRATSTLAESNEIETSYVAVPVGGIAPFLSCNRRIRRLGGLKADHSNVQAYELRYIDPLGQR
jgi:hypothetical protein